MIWLLISAFVLGVSIGLAISVIGHLFILAHRKDNDHV